MILERTGRALRKSWWQCRISIVKVAMPGILQEEMIA